MVKDLGLPMNYNSIKVVFKENKVVRKIAKKSQLFLHIRY